jgi:hypothetical protein
MGIQGRSGIYVDALGLICLDQPWPPRPRGGSGKGAGHPAPEAGRGKGLPYGDCSLNTISI